MTSSIPSAQEPPVLWGIHAGRTGDADRLFKQQNVIALGWHGTPDLASLPDDREAFKETYRKTFPDRGEGNVTASASQLYRFVHEAKAGDFVAYPSKADRRVHFGRITGPYRFEPNSIGGYCHQRPVTWLRDLPRTGFTQGALHELGSALSFFQVKNYLDEHLAVLETKRPPIAHAERDDSVALVADEIQDTTKDFVLRALARELKGHPFAAFVAHLLETMGYRTRLADAGPDGGIDVVAHRDELGFEPPIIKVQVKASEGSIGAPVVQALYGNVDVSEFGLLVTLGTYTAQATTFARGRSNLRLIDGAELVDLVLAHYEDLDSRYKGLIPLKRVYVPEAIEEEGS